MAATDASAVSSSSSAAADKPTKTRAGKHNKQDELKRHRSVFDVSQDFFDSCLLLKRPSSSLPDSDFSHLSLRSLEDVELELESREKLIGNDLAGVPNSSNVDSSSDFKSMQRWSCNTCKAEFESLQDQRFHFKSDLHRFNIKLSISGKNSISEEDFDETTSDSLCKDYDISSISGSEDEDERENGVVIDRQSGNSGVLKSKIFMQFKTGERISVWRCLVLVESENISFENDQKLDMDGGGGVLHLSHKQVIEKLKYIVHEPRDNTCLRIVLLARGGHFAGCVFDGNFLVAHKTFHRYVVRAKAGKKQSSKDAGGRGIHSAGASLRRYNEFALKKDVQELLTSWKPYFAVASCIFIHAPSNNRQLVFDGEKPLFVCRHHAIRSIPLTVRRPTFKEARRIYGLLTQIAYEINEETAPSTLEDPLSGVSIENDSCVESSNTELREKFEGTDISEGLAVFKEMDGLSVSLETKNEDANIDGLSMSLETKNENTDIATSTPLHEAAKSGNSEKVLELLEHGLDPCIRDERGHTPYTLANEKEVRNTFRRFMALNLEKWDWQAAQVPSALTKEMEEAQAAKQAFAALVQPHM
ncbi:uncharacterized protein [Henckelia pumila]|uniref:uncharacterized protein isoform X2 n=1 Tax=Henckelia pumila TaxID=405737 RepID=UPI003C6DE67A